MKDDRGYKKDVYEASGVAEYWIVSPGEKSVEVYLPNDAGLALHNSYTPYPDWALERISAENRAALETHFKCSLFDELDIALEDIF